MSTWRERLNSVIVMLFGWAMSDTAKAEAKAEAKKEDKKEKKD